MQEVLQYALEVVLDHDVFDGKSLGSDIRKSPTEFNWKTMMTAMLYVLKQVLNIWQGSLQRRVEGGGHYGSVSKGQNAQCPSGFGDIDLSLNQW